MTRWPLVYLPVDSWTLALPADRAASPTRPMPPPTLGVPWVRPLISTVGWSPTRPAVP